MRQLLKEIREHNITISVDENNLKLKFGNSSIPELLLDEIRSNKQKLIDYLKENNSATNVETPIPLVDVSDDGYPLSSAQRRLWILSQFEEGLAAYNITNQVTLNGQYEIHRLVNAIYATIDRHEILRTVFKRKGNGDVKQWVLTREELGFIIDIVDYSNEGNAMVAAQNYIDGDTVKSFNLEKGPLLRAALIQISCDKYILYYNLHHIVGDGWSLGVLAKDVLSFYKSSLQGEMKLQPLPIQYKDYATWQKNQVLGQEQDRVYWINLLSGNLPVINLPSSKMRPPIKTQKGHTLEIYLSKGLTDGIRNFAAHQGGSLFMALLSLWNVLVYKFAGQEDVVIGSPVAGRSHADLENQIGFYVNTIVLRNQIKATENFAQFFDGVKKNVLQAFSHQYYPFDSLVEDLNLVRNTSRSAVFDMLLVLQNTGEKISDAPEGVVANVIYDKGKVLSKLDMEINFVSIGEYLSCNVNFNTDVYDRQMVESLMLHFVELSSVLIDNLLIPIHDVDYLSLDEKEKLSQFNKTQIVFQEQGTIIDLFRLKVKEAPDAICVEYKDARLTYLELDKVSNQLAHYLIDQYALKTGELVGISLYRSEWMLVIIWGILKAGGAYVPVDPDYPFERVEYIKTNSGYKVCINQEELNRFILIQSQYSDRQVAVTPSLRDAAYAIYTSGSTGFPKGVLNHHIGLKNRLLWMRDYLGLVKSDITLQKTPYSFDVSVWELLLPSITGSKLVFADPDGHKDPFYLEGVIAEKEITIIHFVPSMLQVFLNNVEANRCRSLKHVICSGEALPSKVVKQFKTSFQCCIHNFYGPTEAAIDVTAIDLTSVDTDLNGVSIGYPIANTKIYIVNDAKILQPIDVPGELLIGGVQVAYGYLNNEPLTKASFIDSPFNPGEIFYRTGDVAKWNRDGSITYLGRRDNQVKIRGHRIELGEITAQLLLLPNIKEAIVSVVKNEGLDNQLTAYIVADVEQNASLLRKYLSGKLPDYEIPSYFIQIDEIPVTSNGKVNLKALPSPFDTAMSTSAAYVAARNEVEKKLVEIFSRVLMRNPSTVGINDNFFDLGGNSIKLIQALNEINNEFKMDMKPVMLFQYANISDLSDNVFLQPLQVESDSDTNIANEIEDLIDQIEN